MKENIYAVHFVKPNIKCIQTAVLGEIAVEKAIKKLEKEGIKPSSLKCKINFWRVN
jgi:hypothetical protein